MAEETCEESYKAHKLELDLETDNVSRIDSQEPRLKNPKSGETDKCKSYRSIENLSQKISRSGTQILTYFLDGSRHVYR